MNAKHLFWAFTMAAALSAPGYAADVVTSGDVDSMGKWYGNGGGLVGSDRVTGLHTGSTKVGVGYDADVAGRTNMQRSQAQPANVGVTYDPDIAARTNMQRGSKAPAPQEVAGSKNN